jgi:N-acetylglucosaminyldiphosphoundecaprenol N-acetyl-beta-D-mannosaminyltransferase
MNKEIPVGIKIYKLFGLQISNLNLEAIIDLTVNVVSNKRKITIGYINPHIARYAEKNKSLTQILNSFTFNHIDGVGMELAVRIFIKQEKFKRLNWTDESLSYLNQCEKSGWKIFLLGSDEETLRTAVEKILIKNPRLKLVGSLNGYDGINEFTVKKINESGTDILWVGTGSLRQESWIVNNYEKLNCSVIQSVGDLYSEIAGKRLRGPVVFRKLGMEWLFRTIQHPVKYFNRYIIGIPVFTLLIIKNLFKRYER